ncbi:DUF3046 domain-containing protein [Leucobacter sp. Psy1]|uniref:DUF3046 domain-containing protein n=1 Tax=Leucobacter sp. Psy1 TaxID=2875729 RepID=UPI00351DA3A8
MFGWVIGFPTRFPTISSRTSLPSWFHKGPVRLSEFQRAMAEEFGQAYSGVLIRDHWLSKLGGTPADALERGVPARTVWVELCEDLQVPPDRRYGRGLREPNR